MRWLYSRVRQPGGERPLADVPLAVRVALAGALLVQLALSGLQPAPQARAQALPVPPSAGVLRALSLGDPIVLAQALTLYLQAFDNQPGVSIPFLELDYARVEAWLERILELDPQGQYPLLLASQVYAQVPDPERERRMLELVQRSFDADPARRWRWLAHAAIMAKHRLQDPELALRYARSLRERTTPDQVPGWARQLEIFIYEDMGQYEAARVLLGGLLDSGAVSDAHELRFLMERLQQLENAEKSSAASKTRLPGHPPTEPAKGMDFRQ
jgi:tetratricopeptide (TPR) repeat protein